MLEYRPTLHAAGIAVWSHSVSMSDGLGSGVALRDWEWLIASPANPDNTVWKAVVLGLSLYPWEFRNERSWTILAVWLKTSCWRGIVEVAFPRAQHAVSAVCYPTSALSAHEQLLDDDDVMMMIIIIISRHTFAWPWPVMPLLFITILRSLATIV